MLLQENSYGCGLYAVANVMDLENYVTDERLEKSKNGVNNWQLSSYLQYDGLELFIDVLYCDTFENKLPKNWTDIFLSGDNNYMPILIQCMVNEKYHLMGAKIFQDSTIELLDSLQKEPIRCTLSDVNKMYEKVVALYSFNHIKNAEYVFF